MAFPFGLVTHFAKLAYEVFQSQQRMNDIFMGTPTGAAGKMFLAAYSDKIPENFLGSKNDLGFALICWLERGNYKITDGRTLRILKDGSVQKIASWSSKKYIYQEDDTLRFKSDLTCYPNEIESAAFRHFEIKWEKAVDPCFPLAHSCGFGEVILNDLRMGEVTATVYGEWIGLGIIDDQFQARGIFSGLPYATDLIERAAQRHRQS